jgi:Tol biopolymer transport system component
MRTLLVLAGLTLTASLYSAEPAGGPAGTIAFASLAPRGWDLYLTDLQTRESRRLTDHPALDYNAAFSPDGRQIAFVSERDGNLELYVLDRHGKNLQRLTDKHALDDHPAWSPDGKRLAFTSTREPSDTPGQAWNGVYVMNADGSGVQRLTPVEVADYSPAWSPKGDLIAVASGSGRSGGTDLYVMKPDGSSRRLVIRDGGWPAFSADGRSLYFHGKRQGKWSIWRVGLDGKGLDRVTPADVEAYTPRTAGKWLVVAVKRGQHRQIERIDTATGKSETVTDDATDHWNPTVSPDGRYVVYHKSTSSGAPHVELWGTPPGTRLQLLRLAGSFPAFSPGGKRLALLGNGFATVDVMNVDGSDRKTIYKGSFRGLFSTSWAHHGDRIAFSHGGVFQGPQGKVELLSVRPDGSDLKPLTDTQGNNGFPSWSPDGKQLVCRSGRAGAKNLYILDAEGKVVRRLTEGKWTDTMADWSPAGDLITFASNRGGEFEVWLVKPDGTGLRKLIGGGGRHNHPHFSPDGKWVVFTSQRAGYSAEEISLPHQPQPYGDLFVIRTDGTGLLRLTHNGFEEGTPAWGPVLDIKPSAAGRKGSGPDY